MPEDLPPVEPGERLSLRDRLKGLRSRVKWPGWSFIILGIITWVPDWKSRLDFWIDIAHSSGSGMIAMGAAIISSPYFSPALVAIGLLYLGLVGEPERGIQRHPRWSYIGWVAFGFCATAIFVTTIVGYVQLSIQRQVGFQIDILQKQLLGKPVFWHLSEYNKTLLGMELDKIPEKDRFPLPFKCVEASAGSQTYLSDIIGVFVAHNWKFNGNCLFANVRPDLLGVYISVSKDINAEADLPKNAKTLVSILNSAQIKFKWAKDPMPKEQFFLVVGYGPDPND